MRRLSLMLAVLLITSAVSAQPKPLRFVTQDFPPFSYIEDGQVAGPAAEIVRLTCIHMQIECSFTLLPWRRALKELRQGRFDGAFLIGWNKPRSEWLSFSEPVLTTEYGLFVRKDSALQYTQPEDLAGLTIAVYGPSNTSHSLQRLAKQTPDITIVERPDDENGFRQLPLGRVDAVYSNRDVGWAIIKRWQLDNIRYAGRHRSLNYFVGFPMKHVSEAQVESFNQTYRHLLREGKVKALLAPYGMKPFSGP